MDDLVKTVTHLEEQNANLSHRMDTLEYKVDMGNSFRYLRIEQSEGLSQLFADVEAGAAQRRGIIRTWRGKSCQGKSVRFSNDPCQRISCRQQVKSWPQRGLGRHWWPMARQLTLQTCPRWWKATQAKSGVFTVRLCIAEPSRLVFAQIKSVISWALFVQQTCRRKAENSYGVPRQGISPKSKRQKRKRQ